MATTPASVGVNHPVTMPPSRMIGNHHRQRGPARGARPIWRTEARPGAPEAHGAEEVAINHQPNADHQPRQAIPPRNSPAMETLPTAP